jgi:hypothetical protein
MKLKHGDPHPTKPGWRFWSWRLRKDGQLHPKWASPENWAKKKEGDPAAKRRYYQKHRKKVIAGVRRYRRAHPKECKERHRKWRANNRARNAFLAIRSRCGRNGIPFNLSFEFFENIPAVCPVLGIPLIRGRRGDQCPHVDRIIPTAGYVVGNAAWISSRANRMKGDLTLTDLTAIAAYIRKFQKLNGTRSNKTVVCNRRQR